jgi:uncharacterized protein
MSEVSEPEAGVPTWIDLSTPDVDASSAFYGALFGWEFEPAGPVEETGGYGNFKLRGKYVAGMGPKQSEEQPTVWSSYVAVDDADETAGKVRDAGGAVIVEPMQVMSAGRMAVFADPTGAAISVWQAGDHKGAGLVNDPGTLVWNELLTRDAEKAKHFYSAVFGWETDAMPYAGGEYILWKLPGREESVGGMMEMGDDWPSEVPPNWMVYFDVGDADAAAATAAESGGTVRQEPFDAEGVGRIAVLSDPHGATFSVIKTAPAQD